MPGSRIESELKKLQRVLADNLRMSPDDIPRSARFATLIPPETRRRVWRELQSAGVPLPELRLSCPVYCIVATLILVPVGLTVFLLKTWSVLLALAEILGITYKATRP